MYSCMNTYAHICLKPLSNVQIMRFTRFTIYVKNYLAAANPIRHFEFHLTLCGQCSLRGMQLPDSVLTILMHGVISLPDEMSYDNLVLVWFCCFTSQVNSYGHCGSVSSPNHTFSWAGLNKRLTSNSCTYFNL